MRCSSVVGRLCWCCGLLVCLLVGLVLLVVGMFSVFRCVGRIC